MGTTWRPPASLWLIALGGALAFLSGHRATDDDAAWALQPPQPAADGVALPARSVDLASVYLLPPLGTVRQVRLRGVIPGRGVLDLDTNTCRIGPAGDIISRTQMDFPTPEVVLRELEARDAGREGVFRVFGVEGADGTELSRALSVLGLRGWTLRVAVGGSPCGPWRMIATDDQGHPARLIPLEQAP